MFTKFAPRWSVAAIAALAVSASLTLAQPVQAQSAPPQSDLLNATLWMQRAVEYKATTMAAYAMARIRLDEGLKNKNWTAAPAEQTGNYQNLPPAIVMDLDETALDNSPYEAWLSINDRSFDPAVWTAWVNSVEALEIPGAVEFAKYAVSKGVKVFYVTNRNNVEEEGTKKNLEKLGFPMGGNVDTLLVSRKRPEWTSTKGIRRAFIAKDYRIVLNVGDNFGDFVDNSGTSQGERLNTFNANLARWGREWIMIPNPAYGSFESEPFGHDFRKPAAEQRTAKRNALVLWKNAPK